jgi:type VI protein secretion system component VasK
MMDFGDFLWLLIWSFLFVCFLMVLFQIFGDLFRDPGLSGWAKAAWVIGLIVLPWLMILIYLIARGKGMAERHAVAMRTARQSTDEYVQSVASRSAPADQIASAKALLDSGTITQTEFDRLKAKALA